MSCMWRRLEPEWLIYGDGAYVLNAGLCVCVAAVHGARQEEVIDHRLTDREWAEEWKHLDNVRVAGVGLPGFILISP